MTLYNIPLLSASFIHPFFSTQNWTDFFLYGEICNHHGTGHDASDFEKLFGLGLENAALGLRPRGHSFSPYGPTLSR